MKVIEAPFGAPEVEHVMPVATADPMLVRMTDEVFVPPWEMSPMFNEEGVAMTMATGVTLKFKGTESWLTTA